MSYGRMQNPHVTMIDELPDLEDLEGVGDNVQMNRPNPQDDRYQKHIRATHRLNPQSGMDRNMEGYGSNNFVNTQNNEMIKQTPPPQEIPVINQPPNHMAIHCIDISKHIQECPICSKFYHNDKTIYIIAIVVLSIVCLLLLKRVLYV